MRCNFFLHLRFNSNMIKNINMMMMTKTVTITAIILFLDLALKKLKKKLCYPGYPKILNSGK